MDTPLALEVANVRKRYGPTVALADTSFSVRKGECHALIGENGAGKSTLVKILSGIVTPDAGELIVGGRPASLRSSREALASGLATAYQELSLIPQLTVAQNMMLGREPRGRFRLTSNDTMAEATRRICDEWELEGVDPDAHVSDLSLALRQQIELVRAFSRNSEVLLLDEPTAALGVVQVEWLFRQMRRVLDRAGTLVFISHRMGEVRSICDRTTVLRGGRNVATFDTQSASDDEVIEMMAGHSVEQVFAESGEPAEIGPPVVTLDGVSAAPGLHDATFTLHHGEILGVAALQGHGQLELFTGLFGARRITGGTVSIGERTVRLRSPRQAIRHGIGISLVPEDRKAEGVLVNMSGLVNVTLPSIRRYARLGFLSKRAERVAATRVFRQLDIKLGALDDDVSSLSGGNQQKVAIGKWMLADNKVLLLYDPTRGVDVGTKTEIFKLMREMAADGRSILFYSTDIEELLGVTDRVIVFYRGRVVAELAGDARSRNSLLAAMLGGAVGHNGGSTGAANAAGDGPATAGAGRDGEDS